MALPVSTTGNLLTFPRGRAHLGAALKRHRLPENLAAALVREAANFPEISSDAALAFALAQRMAARPIDFEQVRGILLVGPTGSGKSAVAAKICHAAALFGRDTERTGADGLALFRAAANTPDRLIVMEADGFNPLNARAASAFSALGDTPGVETIGVISALSDAEDVSDIVTALRFRRIIVTGMDRTRRLGACLAAITGGAALAHVTRSARPQDALEILEPGQLASLLLDVSQH